MIPASRSTRKWCVSVEGLSFPADFAIRPDELAVAVEERGFDSLFLTEHTHLPCSPNSMSTSRCGKPSAGRRTQQSRQITGEEKGSQEAPFRVAVVTEHPRYPQPGEAPRPITWGTCREKVGYLSDEVRLTGA